MRFYCGLDLGKLGDPSALAVLERLEEGDYRRYECRHLHRFPLRTRYTAIVESVGELLDRAPVAGACQLVIDHTGVGVAVAELFDEAGIPYIGVTITGGVGWHRDPQHPRQYYVSKHLLVSTVQKFLSSEAIGISKHLPEAETLRTELRDFRVKISKAANETYESREGATDDVLLGVAIALFVGEHGPRRFAPVGT
jgi:hypothetical protein